MHYVSLKVAVANKIVFFFFSFMQVSLAAVFIRSCSVDRDAGTIIMADS